PSVEIHVLQGERSMAKDNKTIGRFNLQDIPPAPRGIPQIEVTFDIDANGILNVSAKDNATGKEQKIRIEASSGLTDAEIEAMRREAEANAASDQAARESAEKINAADSMIFQTEKQLTEYGEKLSEANKTAIETALQALKTAHGSQDIAGIDKAMEDLNAAWSTASTEMYQAAGGAEGAANGAGAEGAANGAENGEKKEEDNVTDVDYEEVDKDKS
ncbi:MAG: Hsp70 family protein, partial [Flammeovirgaceae bacterium]